MTKRKWITIITGLVVVVALGSWLAIRSGSGDVQPYRTSELRRGTVESTVTSTGKLNAVQSVAVGTQVSGRITELYADYNDRVREGDLIARIDPIIQQQQVRNAEANLERVQAALLQAEREFERGKVLYEQQVITETEFQKIEYDLTVAQSNLSSSEVSLEQARQNLSYTEIYAPIDGIVVERNVEPGQTVAASMSAPQLYLLASDLREIEILATVDESDIGQIRNGMEVRFTVQAYPTTTFIGTVRQVRLSSTTQENVVNYTAVISVQNPDGRLLPGMTATVDFISEQATDVLYVPNAALRLRATDEMIAQLTDTAMIAIARGEGGAGGTMAMMRTANGDGAAMRENLPPEAAALIAERMANGGGAGAGAGRVMRAQGPQGEVRTTVLTDADFEERRPFVPGGTTTVSSSRPGAGTLWYLKDGKLGVVRVRTGISDGSNTEVIVEGLEEGTEIIIGLNTATATQGGAQQTTNPFQQQRGAGGFGGPGGATFIVR